jgi:hypothetical protein
VCSYQCLVRSAEGASGNLRADAGGARRGSGGPSAYRASTRHRRTLVGRRAIVRFLGEANFLVHASGSIFASFPLFLTAFRYAAPIFALRQFGR